MSKILYIEKSFSLPSLAVIKQANDIIKEYDADGMKLTLRQLYYQFVVSGEDNMARLGFKAIGPPPGTHNNNKSYKRLGNIVNDARLAGLISWEAIEDRVRNLVSQPSWSNPGEILESARRSFKLDHWEGQTCRPEIWIEKEALVGVISEICKELDVPYFACKGYVSQSEMWGASQRLLRYREQHGQQPFIIHLGDHDPSGIDMTRDIIDRQKTFAGHIEVLRIALNMSQIEEYNPPPQPAKRSDSRGSGYIEKHGGNSWELDALEPRVMKALIKKTILQFRNEDIYQEVIRQEDEYIETLMRVEENWPTL